MESTEAKVASRWFGVRAEYEPAGRARKFALILRYLGLSFLTAGLTASELDARRRGRVVLFRRDDGHTLVTYEYDHPGEMHNHVLSLEARLPATHVFDLCREVGLSTDYVVGPGTDEPPAPVECREIPAPQQTPW